MRRTVLATAMFSVLLIRPVSAQYTEDLRTLIVHCPTEAVVWVDSVRTQSTGNVRQYVLHNRLHRYCSVSVRLETSKGEIQFDRRFPVVPRQASYVVEYDESQAKPIETTDDSCSETLRKKLHELQKKLDKLGRKPECEVDRAKAALKRLTDNVSQRQRELDAAAKALTAKQTELRRLRERRHRLNHLPSNPTSAQFTDAQKALQSARTNYDAALVVVAKQQAVIEVHHARLQQHIANLDTLTSSSQKPAQLQIINEARRELDEAKAAAGVEAEALGIHRKHWEHARNVLDNLHALRDRLRNWPVEVSQLEIDIRKADSEEKSLDRKCQHAQTRLNHAEEDLRKLRELLDVKDDSDATPNPSNESPVLRSEVLQLPSV